MKITGFNPIILTTDMENTIKLFEALGFERSHTKDGLDGRDDITGVRLKDANGFCVDVTESKNIKKDMVSIRMNVDDFEKARKMLEDQGFKSASEEVVTDASSKSSGMFSPSGFLLSLVEHIKK